ncbi:molybdenum cofactor biosynthesis protein MoaE, partial [Clostridium tertium]
MKRFEITKTTIITEDIIKKVEKREAGAITTFIGTVREWTNGKRTVRLEYEAYEPMA